MASVQEHKKVLMNTLEHLPEEKVAELVDFANFLTSSYTKKSTSQVGENSLLLQQKSLGKIWDSPEEDVYEL